MANDLQAEAPAPQGKQPEPPVDRVLAALKPKVPDHQGREILARALLASADAATLEALPTARLVALVDRAMAFMQTKPLGASKIAVSPLPDGRSVLEVLNLDMPFLLDSVFGELHARGFPISLVLHPLVKTERDADGRLVKVVGAGDRQWSDGRQESYIAVEFERLPAGEGEKIIQVIDDILGEVRLVVGDWKPMLARLQKAIKDLRWTPASVPEPVRNEAMAFLEWL
jgi:glutamate dehydrogenase